MIPQEIPVGTLGCDLKHDHPDGEEPPEVKVVVYFHVPARRDLYSAEHVMSMADNARRAQALEADITALVNESYSGD